MPGKFEIGSSLSAKKRSLDMLTLRVESMVESDSTFKG